MDGATLEAKGAALGWEGLDKTCGERGWEAGCAAPAATFACMGCVTMSLKGTLDIAAAVEAGC